MYFVIKRAILTCVKYLCIALIWLMSAVIFAGVVCRICEWPLVWAEELSLTSVVWLTFIGSSLAFELNSHVVVDLVMNQLPGTGKRLLKVLVNALVAALSVVLVTAGYTITLKTMRSITPGLNISVAVQYFPACLGGVLMLWLACEKIVYSIRSLAAGRDVEPPRAVLPPRDAAVVPAPAAKGGNA